MVCLTRRLQHQHPENVHDSLKCFSGPHSGACGWRAAVARRSDTQEENPPTHSETRVSERTSKVQDDAARLSNGPAATESSQAAPPSPAQEVQPPKPTAAPPLTETPVMDDLTAELLGIRVPASSRQQESQQGQGKASPTSLLSTVVGFPLAAWALLDTLLPEPLRSGTQQSLAGHVLCWR
jgi:hypothetical protein